MQPSLRVGPENVVARGKQTLMQKKYYCIASIDFGNFSSNFTAYVDIIVLLTKISGMLIADFRVTAGTPFFSE